MDRDQYFQNLRNRVVGDQNPNSVHSALEEVAEYLEMDSDDVVIELEGSYDVVKCMNCCGFFNPEDTVTFEDENMCRDCAAENGWEDE